ncbi:MAG: hypothetical protein ACUVX8_15065 [Candidatus Zipacnadales bacterium]
MNDDERYFAAFTLMLGYAIICIDSAAWQGLPRFAFAGHQLPM